MTILKSLSYQAWYVRQVWTIIPTGIEEESNFFNWKSVPLTLRGNSDKFIMFFFFQERGTRGGQQRDEEETERLLILHKDSYSCTLSFSGHCQVVDFACFCKQGVIERQRR